MSESPRRIAYQGEKGANSHLACERYAPKMESVPCPTFEDVFQMVTEDRAELAMIPIENSLAGRVAAIHHLLPQSNLYIIGEHFEPVHFALLGLPEATLSDLRFVYSHIMALGQCRHIIRELGLKPIATSDTAGAAREVAEDQNIQKAALAPLGAAEIYGLQPMKTEVEDDTHNITRFLVLRKTPLVIEQQAIEREGWITSFIFRVRNIPAALYKALGGFASHGVNMIRLESGLIEPPFTITEFYADIQGHPESEKIKGAMEELHFFADRIQILGTYPESPFRHKKV